MESSVGKITWGYIWRLILWCFAVSFVFSFILGIIVGAGASNYNPLDLDSVLDVLSSYKIMVVGYVIVNILTIIISCRYATSGIIKKFDINNDNKNSIIRNIIIVLVICAVLLVGYNIMNMSNITEALEETDESISDLRDMSYSEETDEVVDSLEGLASMTKVAIVIIVISNGVVILGMVPFVRKWINNAATTA